MTTDEFDVVVLGAGPTGENAAGRAAGHGLSVAIVERELVGGECSYWGCIPSKTLLRPGDLVAAARRAPGAAEAITGPIDVRAAFAQRDYMTSSWDDSGQLPWLESHGIAFVRGHGRLTGERSVAVTTAEGERALTARRAVVLATGTVSLIPPIPGLVDAAPWDNRSATAAKEVPRRLLVLGGGAVGVEMAQAFRRLGSDEVTVVEGSSRLLSREEPFAGAEVQAAFEREGIRVLTGVAMTEVRRPQPGAPVTATLADGTTVEGDEILVAVGRRPHTSDLGLETIGLEPGRYVEVDDQLRAVGVPGGWLFATGDVNGLALLTHMGKYQARIAGDVIAGKDARDQASHDIVPRVTFCDPQVCAVGLTEQQARERYDDIRTTRVGTGDVAGAYTQGNDITGTSYLVVDAAREVIVGATFTGPLIAELLHSATIAIAGEVPLSRLWHAVPSFPTISEVWLRLMEEYGL
ncbi:MAG TPA: NAD(P)/FAD-dependent oxidoreductase [Mycobacteriales bacterium]|nr:NAD(P)/FAD-dependent oxidoreductase [Mycobacteriales bacterium]